MLAPLSELPSPDLIFHNPLYYKHPYSLQIIQLVECSAPPPRHLSSHSALYSSPAPSSSSSDYSSNQHELADDQPDDDEEICSSYCSSDVPPEQLQSTHQDPSTPYSPSSLPDTYDLRMKRILAWRENFSAAMSAAFSDSTLSNSLKRKFHDDRDGDGDDYDDSMSHSSKRSRTSDSSTSMSSSFGEHSCPACDATFSSRQSLRQHGLDAAKENEACSFAVEYAFE